MMVSKQMILIWILAIFIPSVIPKNSAIDNHCDKDNDGLIPTGPCEATLVYCNSGHATLVSCPPSLIFNPSSKFCEQPEDFVLAILTEDVQGVEKLVTEDYDDFSPSHVVLSPHPQSDAQEVEDPEIEDYDDFPPSIVMLSPHSQSNLVDEDQQEKNALVDHDYEPHLSYFDDLDMPVDGDYDAFKVKPKGKAATSSSASLNVPLKFGHDIFLSEQPDKLLPNEGEQEKKGLMDHFKGQNDYAPHVSYFAPLDMPVDGDHDAFKVKPKGKAAISSFASLNVPLKFGHDIFLSKQPDNLLPNEGEQEKKGLVDHFKGQNDYEPHVSYFAPMDMPVDAGHDAFKVKPKGKATISSFASLNVPLKFGHDIFLSKQLKRYRRSVDEINGRNIGLNRNMHKMDAELLEKCKHILDSITPMTSHSEANKVPRMNEMCSNSQFPTGCRSFYLACVQGHLIKRQCPQGFFLDPVKENCERRELIGACAVGAGPRTLSPTTYGQRSSSSPLTYGQRTPSPTTNGQRSSNNPTTYGQRTPSPITYEQRVSSKTFGQRSLSSTIYASKPRPTSDAFSSPQNVYRRRPLILPSYAHFFPERFCTELPDGFWFLQTSKELFEDYPMLWPSFVRISVMPTQFGIQ